MVDAVYVRAPDQGHRRPGPRHNEVIGPAGSAQADVAADGGHMCHTLNDPSNAVTALPQQPAGIPESPGGFHAASCSARVQVAAICQAVRR